MMMNRITDLEKKKFFFNCDEYKEWNRACNSGYTGMDEKQIRIADDKLTQAQIMANQYFPESEWSKDEFSKAERFVNDDGE